MWVFTFIRVRAKENAIANQHKYTINALHRHEGQKSILIGRQIGAVAPRPILITVSISPWNFIASPQTPKFTFTFTLGHNETTIYGHTCLPKD